MFTIKLVHMIKARHGGWGKGVKGTVSVCQCMKSKSLTTGTTVWVFFKAGLI